LAASFRHRAIYTTEAGADKKSRPVIDETTAHACAQQLYAGKPQSKN